MEISYDQAHDILYVKLIQAVVGVCIELPDEPRILLVYDKLTAKICGITVMDFTKVNPINLPICWENQANRWQTELTDKHKL
jgi:uncharacterized protein YuzE